ncbi:CP [Hippeastrum latent virus]|nr:CP [Hippeastrum latent virus]
MATKAADKPGDPNIGDQRTTKPGGNVGTTTATDSFGDEELEVDQLEERMNKLREFLMKQQRAVQITNPSFELGRPKLQMLDSVRSDPTNLYNKPTIDQLCRIRPKSISNNMATSQDMAAITVAIESLGVPSEKVQTVIIQAVAYCKDASSSAYLDPQGTFEWDGGAIMADAVLAILKRDAGTLRRVCRLYAPVTWNHMLAHNAPPSDWAAMGFQYTERFAAFDCFDYVENQAAVQPFEGLIRRPTPAEKLAHNTHKRIALDRANRNERFSNLEAEITGGLLGPEIERSYWKR